MTGLQYRAVLFDLDGTLLYTLDDIARAANRVLEKRGFPPHPVEAYRLFIGHGPRTLIQRVLPEKERRPETVDACTGEFLEAYDADWPGTTKPFDGIPDLLRFLEDRGLRLAVLSNKAHMFTVKGVERFFPGCDFEVVLGYQDGLPLKPDPAGALRIAESMDLSPEHFMYVGDSPTDMKTARGAGMYPVGVLWGLRGESELKAAGAELIVSHPSQIAALFNF